MWLREGVAISGSNFVIIWRGQGSDKGQNEGLGEDKICNTKYLTPYPSTVFLFWLQLLS